jgi:hypothetical protein
MTEREAAAAMAKGAVLCMGFEKTGEVYWLEPRRIIIRRDVAKKIIGLPGIDPGGDSLFKDAVCQTWKLKKVDDYPTGDLRAPVPPRTNERVMK